MKKIIVSLLMFACCLFCFAGCGESLPENYWQDTSTKLTSFFDSEEFKATFNGSYNSNIDSLMEQDYGKIYLELKEVYLPLYEQSIFCSQKYANVFMAVPTNKTNKLKSKFIEINSNLSALSQEIEKFATDKANYISNIDFSDEQTATSQIEIARLNKFKKSYLSLLQKAYTLSSSIFDAYTIGYYNFIDFSNIEANELTASQIDINLKLALNGSNLQLGNSAINVLCLYLNKEVENDYDDFWQSSKTFFGNAVKEAYNKDFSSVDVSEMYNKFKLWQGVYSEFVEDAKTFNDILKDINLDVLKRYEDDTFAYAQATKEPTNQGKANFFLNYSQNVDLLFDYASNLIQD